MADEKYLIKYVDTDGCRSLTTLLVKYYNDLLDRQSSGRARDEVTLAYIVVKLLQPSVSLFIPNICELANQLITVFRKYIIIQLSRFF